VNGEAVLAWLDGMFLAQRRTLYSVLESQHHELVREVGMQIKVQRPPLPPQFADIAAGVSAQDSRAMPYPQAPKKGPQQLILPPGCMEENEGQLTASHSETREELADSSEVRLQGNSRDSEPQACFTDNVMPATSFEATIGNREVSRARAHWAKSHGLSRGLTQDFDTGGGICARLKRLVKSDTFETGFAFLILLNTIILALEQQYHGIENGYLVSYSGTYRRAAEAWPGALEVFEMCEMFFGVAFTVELVLKVPALQRKFFSNFWNVIDTIIVGAWLFSTFGSVSMPLDPMLLRLARLARLLRLLRLIRTIRLFDSLYLMTTAMSGSISVLLWSVILLALVQMALALLLQQLVEDYVLDASNPLEKRRHVFKYYGTFARAMLTMFEMTLGNWMPPCRALVENVSEWYMLFSLIHKLVIGFSVVSVITSVFVQETFKVATTDDRIMMMTKARAAQTHLRKIGALFNHADANGDNLVDIDEFNEVLGQPDMRLWLAAMELDVRDAKTLFWMLDRDTDGRLTVKELVEGMSKLRGTAKNFDMVALQHATNELKDLVNQVLTNQSVQQPYKGISLQR